MREFFLLTYDIDRDDLERVSDHEIGDFDLPECAPFEGRLPATVRLSVEPGIPSDYLANPLGWHILSERFWQLIQPLAATTCQIIPPPLNYHHNGKTVFGYHLVNVFYCLSAAVGIGEPGFSLTDLVLRGDQIPDDVHVFVIAESSTIVVVSDAILQAVWGKQLKGVAFIKTKMVKSA